MKTLMTHLTPGDSDNPNPSPETGHWLTGRFSHSLDRLWFGSVLCVAILVTVFYGIGYVPLFVLGWFVVFVRIMRKRIRALASVNQNFFVPGIMRVMDAENTDPSRKKKSVKESRMAVFGINLVFGVLGALHLSGLVSIYAIAVLSIILNCLSISSYLVNHREMLIQIAHRPHGKLHYALIICAWCAVAWMFFRHNLGYAVAGRLVFENMWLIVLTPLALLITLYGFIYSHILYRNITDRRKKIRARRAAAEREKRKAGENEND